MSTWYYLSNGQQVGPVNARSLKVLAAGGQILPNDKVWREGLPDWVSASKVRGLFAAAEHASESEPHVVRKAAAPVRRRANNKALWITAKVAAAIAIAAGLCLITTAKRARSLPPTRENNAVRLPSTTRPVTETVVDLSTPTRAVLAFARASESGDSDTVRSITVDSPPYRDLVSQWVALGAAGRKLEDAAVARFGAAGRGMSEPFATLLAKKLENGVVEKVEGDRAGVGTVRVPDVLKFRRVGGAWKFDPEETFKNVNVPVEYAVDVDKIIVSGLLDGVTMIQSGKFSDANEAHSMIVQSITLRLKPLAPTREEMPAYVPPKDPTNDPNAVLILFESRDDHIVATLSGVSFDVDVPDQRANLARALRELLIKKMKGNTQQNKIRAALKPRYIPMPAIAYDEVGRVCTEVGFERVDCLTISPDTLPTDLKGRGKGPSERQR